ncbi:hypothetical protein AKJ40_04400 [candidate division MSBL1 archaeon SCGC-AAA259M10]|uniref:Potassium transporter TrkA n=1 Tax=candidate division MSBL1 archaeon SCGC-AAA259M10 TaxID=1698270 RepID=A0A133UXE9_9EURY|nr:hypothetical protein AKJ40_04400 [candidate division MSBL1 archaeon SCGC-AAA259M10]
MYIIIVGGGRAGKNLAKRFIDTDHEVAIVESEEERAYELTQELDALVIHGSGTDIEILRDAGGERADALVALAPSDEVNLMACKLANDLEIPRIITRVNKSEHAKMFEEVGADVAVSYITATAGLYEKAVTGPEIFGLLSMGGKEANVLEVSIDEESKVVGKAIEELDLPELCTIAIITREGELIPPRGETTLEAEDRVILAGRAEDVQSVSRMFRGK